MYRIKIVAVVIVVSVVALGYSYFGAYNGQKSYATISTNLIKSLKYDKSAHCASSIQPLYN